MTEEKDYSKMNHVVVATKGMAGRWGRGHDLQEAMRNARINFKASFTYFIFKNDDWDILDTGTVEWPKGCLLSKQQIN